jgi:ribosomal protein S18 acetylase RimI-like enzyme
MELNLQIQTNFLTMNIQIKKIDRTEYKIVVEMFNKYRVFYKQPSDLHLAENYLKERLENNQAHIFIAFSEELNLLIGFALLYPKFSSVSAKKNWHIGDLYVEQEYRKLGIGNKLIQTAIDFAKEENAVFVSLNTALDNYTAQNLYENFGFEKREPTPGYLYYQYNL